MRRDGINGINGRDGENREITHQAKRYPSSFSVPHQAQRPHQAVATLPSLPTLPTPVMLSEAKHLSVGANVERPC